VTIQVDIQHDVPVPTDNPPIELPMRIAAAAETTKLLGEHGLSIEATSEDKTNAAAIATAFAEDPIKTAKKATPKRTAALTPATLLLTDRILKEFGHSVVKNSIQIRHLVTNKLIEETDNVDARIRIRALELLGKISDVGLFAEKAEVTVTHQTTDDIRSRLRDKLTNLIDITPEDDIEDAVILDGQVVDIDTELGLDDER
jgi:hypothetical protein|tara:strand:- start:2248 stop:2850 length:603 start_codon:yes stop_codon:yes gene_type:complete